MRARVNMYIFNKSIEFFTNEKFFLFFFGSIQKIKKENILICNKLNTLIKNILINHCPSALIFVENLPKKHINL